MQRQFKKKEFDYERERGEGEEKDACGLNFKPLT